MKTREKGAKSLFATASSGELTDANIGEAIAAMDNSSHPDETILLAPSKAIKKEMERQYPGYRVVLTASTEDEDEIKVCPKMRCGNCLIFPEYDLPCAKHGVFMVKQSEMPLRKQVYRFLMRKIFRFKYATHKLRTKS